MIKHAFAMLLLACLPQAASALECKARSGPDFPFTLCTINVEQDAPALALADDAGTTYGNFARLEQALAEQGQRLTFAMNAGMFHADRSPVGLYIEDGGERSRIVTREGPGNFGLLPNGVLCLTETNAEVIESRAFAAAPPTCTFATQSGPMLVIDGALHPRFLVNSTSRYVRNGVGVSEDGRTLYAVISDAPVTFHQFGRLFRDVLKVKNALYLDGNVSRMYAQQAQRFERGFALGPILYTTEEIDMPAPSQ